MPHRVLLVDDNPAAFLTLGNLLRVSGYQCLAAAASADGVRIAREFSPHVAVIALRPPGLSGVETLRQLRRHLPATACVLFTGCATLDLMVEAIRLGACDCVPMPALDEDVLAAVQRALRVEGGAVDQLLSPKPHALTRWAETIALFIDAPEDAATLRDFAAAVGASVGAFRNWCRTAGLSPRRSLHLARALRAVYQSERLKSSRPQNLLRIVDLRTLAKFMIESGGTKDRLPADVRALLERQQFIADGDAILAMRHAVTARERRGRAATRGRAAAALDPSRRQRPPATEPIA
jgi:ActR/RegA family two-component response regulator